MKAPPELNRIADKVLAYNPGTPKGPLKVIAGAPDQPLRIGDIEIPCYVLEDETRVLSQSGMFAGLGLARRGLVVAKNGARLPRFAASKAIFPFISNELSSGLASPLVFNAKGRDAYGFPATILPKICNAVLAARRAGALDPQQAGLAGRCEVLIEGLAETGIIALVDEATGYQRVRAERALATILEQFIAKEFQPWTKTFPFDFYDEICRLKNWPDVHAIRRPSVIGKYTNDIVYERLAPGVLEELQSINPKLPQGGRKHKHHQWFTPEHGHPRLREHLAAVIALMKNANTWDSFMRSLDKVFTKKGHTRPLQLDEPEP